MQRESRLESMLVSRKARLELPATVYNNVRSVSTEWCYDEFWNPSLLVWVSYITRGRDFIEPLGLGLSDEDLRFDTRFYAGSATRALEPKCYFMDKYAARNVNHAIELIVTAVEWFGPQPEVITFAQGLDELCDEAYSHVTNGAFALTHDIYRRYQGRKGRDIDDIIARQRPDWP
jgi:hypothetical protein